MLCCPLLLLLLLLSATTAILARLTETSLQFSFFALQNSKTYVPNACDGAKALTHIDAIAAKRIAKRKDVRAMVYYYY